jgi:hypothetical protein
MAGTNHLRWIKYDHSAPIAIVTGRSRGLGRSGGRSNAALAVGSTVTAFPASSQYTTAERAGLFLKAGESHSDHD